MLDGYPTNELMDVVYNRIFENEAELTQLRAERARLTAEVEAGWIPVTEKLPDERGHYLAAGKYLTGHGWVNKLYFDDDQEWYDGQSLRRSTTHWRPLPAHPHAKE